MAFNHGSVATILFASVEYSADFKNVNFDTSIDIAETSALGTTSKTYVPGLESSKLKCGGMLEPTMEAALVALKRTITTFEYRPAGTGTGKVKYTGSCIITTLSIGTGVGDMASFDADVQVTGPVTRGTQS